jgi:hypothetical protein
MYSVLELCPLIHRKILFTLARSEGIRDIYICKTQINIQSLIDVQSSNPCPIPTSQTSVPQIYVPFHILKLAPNDVTAVSSGF